jgi:hypothetical protein
MCKYGNKQFHISIKERFECDKRKKGKKGEILLPSGFEYQASKQKVKQTTN